MVIYVDPRLIGRKNFEELVNTYPTINFITEIKNESEVEVMFTMPTIVKNMNISNYKKLRFIQYLMAGYDGVNLEELKENNIIFSNAQDIFSKSIAEDVITKILYFNRNVKHYIDCKKKAEWDPIREEPELTNSTVLLIGTGSISKEVAQRLKAFETYIIGYRRTYKEEKNFDEIIVNDEDLNAALQRADYVILALPLNEKTKYFFDKEKLNMMKSSALLINVARGKVVNQNDLYNTLRNNQIRGAGLDVFDPEPLPKDNPLWKLENVYITPHNASSSNFMRDRLYQLILTNLKRYLEEQPVLYRLN